MARLSVPAARSGALPERPVAAGRHRRLVAAGHHWESPKPGLGAMPETKNFHYEIELIVAIGTGGANILKERTLEHVYCCGVGIDLTRRDLQLAAREQGRPWDWGKGFDLSAPIAPLHPVSEVGHPSSGRIWLAVDGQVKQDSDIAKLIWPVEDIIANASRSMELRPGDLIMTGTPEGVGPVKPGETMTGRIDGLGDIRISAR